MLLRTFKGAVWLLIGLFIIALAIPAQAADVTFTGKVAYRERMALPADASLVVNLVTLPGGQRIAGAQASLGKTSSPFQFTLNVRSGVIADGGTYGLVAEIWSLGYPVFTNVQPVPVDPAAPTDILIPVQYFTPPPHPAPRQILPAPDAPNPLLDVVWTVTSIGGDPVVPPGKITFSIAADHRVGGSGGCNSYFAEADFIDQPLSFSPIAGTKMMCAPALMAQENRFFSALQAVAGYEMVNQTLKLSDAAGVPLIGLIRQP